MSIDSSAGSSPDNMQAFVIKEKLASLEDALLNKHPQMPVLLRDIHSMLSKDVALVTLLSPEECSILVRGIKKHVGVDIATKVVKSRVTAKKVSQLTLADL